MTTAFITLTNKGYLPYTFNCLKSLERLGIDDLKCYAIGKRAFGRIRHKKYSAELINDETNTAFQSFRKGKWANVTFYKFEIIYENLKKNDFVCFTDGDIVFKKRDFFDYCLANIKGKDMLIQNDTLSDASDKNLCSGFMFIRSNKNTLDFFNPELIKSNSNIVEGWGDQLYINQNKSQLSYKILPLSLFPNGQYFFKNHANIAPYLIHFNWLIGHEKAAQFIKYRECYSAELLMLYIQKNLVSKCKKMIKRVLRITGILPTQKVT